MILRTILRCFCLLLLTFSPGKAQELTPFLLESGPFGKALISVESTSDNYYVLYYKEQEESDFIFAIDLKVGTGSTITLTDRLTAADETQYQVIAHPLSAPADIDGDGIDDISEFNDFGIQSPFNTATPVSAGDGLTYVADTTILREYSFLRNIDILGAQLDELQTIKFYVLDVDDEFPRLYFLNANTHVAHSDFAAGVDLELSGRTFRGQIGYHPNIASANGTDGIYRFRFQPTDILEFQDVRKIQKLLSTHLGFINNNLCYYPMPAALSKVEEEQALYDDSRVCLLYENDLYGDVDYLPMNLTEGYGLLKIFDEEETPLQTDIVILTAIPNELSRIGGIITTVPQTPLAHVNLRAIQDQVPNAFIRHAVETDSIIALLGKYVYYKVEDLSFTLVETTQEEVDAHFETIRPKQNQTPPRDLSQTNILPLDEINFEDSEAFGAKCCNLATMRDFDFPDGTIPDGFGIPFYYYDAFMKHNDFYSVLTEILEDPDFSSDVVYQEEWLKEFRNTIKDAEIPAWMFDDLLVLQESFPDGTSIRCRSSSNNEDLPGFSGAGLYDSKTQHPDEGHIQKSVKQIYASTWNFRAFREREFYRINHLETAMGVLCHPNFTDEKVNGVAVSIDPLHGTLDNYFVNSQKGEDLVTNPEASSIPEELLVHAEDDDIDPVILRLSNLNGGNLLLSTDERKLLRAYLNTIHKEFFDLYQPDEMSGFGMEIEFKLTADDQLIIKQARPWAGYWTSLETPAEPHPDSLVFGVSLNPNPSRESTTLSVTMEKEDILDYLILDRLGRRLSPMVSHNLIRGKNEIQLSVLDEAAAGLYYVMINIGEGRLTLPYVKI